jgi:hypothetical protein
MTTRLTVAGWSALTTKVAVSSLQGMMSIFSPCSSCTTAWTRLPFMPTQAPTGSMLESRLITPILARLPGSRAAALMVDDAVVDFGHFLREQLLHEFGVRAAEEDLRATVLAFHLQDQRAHAFADAGGFARDLLIAADHALGAAQVDDDVAEFDRLDHAGDDFARAVLEFLVLAITLGIADLLEDHLLGRLRIDAAQIDRRQRIDDEVAQLGARLRASRPA